MPQPERGQLLRLSVGSRLAEVDVVEAALTAVLAEVPLAEDELRNLLLAAREAVINAVVHGGGLDPERRVEVAVDRHGGSLVVRVRDDGPGFDPGAVPDPRTPENLLKPNGRGIFLMRQFVDEVEYSFPTERGTVVTLRKAITEPPELREEITG